MKLLEGQRINESFLQCAGYTFQYCPQVGKSFRTAFEDVLVSEIK